MIIGSERFWQKSVKYYVHYRVLRVAGPAVFLPIFFFSTPAARLIEFYAVIVAGLCAAVVAGVLFIYLWIAGEI